MASSINVGNPDAPEGYEYRWIRAEIVGQEDKKNVTARLREGFDLVRAEELDGFEIPTLDDGKHSGVVSVGWFALPRFLMKRAMKETPTLKIAQTQQDAVDHDLLKGIRS